MQRVNVAEITAHLPELIEAASKGETVLILNEQQEAIAQLGPVHSEVETHPTPTFGSGAGLIWMADDFDAPLDDFADYQ
jgi:antitoxin (DNA-binding transcriptional repressor) of toxin-antitoxin stability system